MVIENDEIYKILEPRFEFRTFGKDLNQAVKLMAKLSTTVPEKVRRRKSEEIYIISSWNDINSIKIRDEKIDVKTLMQSVKGLELWKPLIKVKFPMSSEILENDIFPLLTENFDSLENRTYTIKDFLRYVNKYSEIKVVTVKKERYGYMINDTICEYAKVWINKTMVATVSSESTEISNVNKTIKELGLNGFENINYLQAAKRVTGMIDKKLAN